MRQDPRQEDHDDRDLQHRGGDQQELEGDLDLAGVARHHLCQEPGLDERQDVGCEDVEHHHHPQDGDSRLSIGFVDGLHRDSLGVAILTV